MGSLRYGYDSRSLEFDDRTLAHLRIAIVTKLRRHESFTLSFGSPAGEGRGQARETVWLHPAIPVRFTFDAPSPDGGVNRAWLEALTRSGDSGDMKVSPEPVTGQDR